MAHRICPIHTRNIGPIGQISSTIPSLWIQPLPKGRTDMQWMIQRATVPGKWLIRQIMTSFSFTLVTHEDVNKTSLSLRTKTSTGIYGISVKLLKSLAPVLTNPVTLIINQSLTMGIFPSKLKIAKVLPLLKKNDPHIMDNYRPISLLTSISKLFEKVVFNQLFEYFHKNNLFYDSQYGFRKLYSTELAAMELTNKILVDIDEKNVSLTVFMDLRKAFDTLDHDILLNKLQYYGITGTALAWFTSYLKDRKQFVVIDGSQSGMLSLSTGVPQGSILGPLLFLIYMNDIPNSSDNFTFILYADDTTLYSCIQLPSSTLNHINDELDKVYAWLAINKLSLNMNKTKYMIFHAINKSIEGIIPNLVINGIQIHRVNSFNFLGLNLHENMSWKTHTEFVANKLAKYSGVLNRIKHFLPIDVLRKLYFSMVQSQLQYGILAWGFDHSRLDKLQKRIIRIITQSKYKSHCDPLFNALEILKIKDLFELNCLKFLYNFKKGLLPKYFMSFRCSPRSSIHDHDTRYASQIDTISTRTIMASNRIRCRLPDIINSTTESIFNKIETHSLHGFSQFAKRFFIYQYPTHCFEINCYVCRN